MGSESGWVRELDVVSVGNSYRMGSVLKGEGGEGGNSYRMGTYLALFVT